MTPKNKLRKVIDNAAEHRLLSRCSYRLAGGTREVRNLVALGGSSDPNVNYVFQDISRCRPDRAPSLSVGTPDYSVPAAGHRPAETCAALPWWVLRSRHARTARLTGPYEKENDCPLGWHLRRRNDGKPSVMRGHTQARPVAPVRIGWQIASDGKAQARATDANSEDSGFPFGSPSLGHAPHDAPTIPVVRLSAQAGNVPGSFWGRLCLLVPVSFPFGYLYQIGIVQVPALFRSYSSRNLR